MRNNIAFNVLGRVWQAFITIFIVPVYIGLVGVEGYALVAMYSVFVASAQLFDLGIPGVVTRELAKLGKGPSKDVCGKSLFCAVERIYLSIYLFLSILFLFGIEVVSAYGGDSGGIFGLDKSASMFFGVAVCVQAPLTIYKAGLLGLERQVALNILNIVTTAIAAIGGLIVLKMSGGGLGLYFIWVGAVSIMQLVSYRYFLMVALPVTNCGCGELLSHVDVLKRHWRYSGMLYVTTLMVIVITYLDRFMVGAMTATNALGIYLMASTAASSLNLIPAPLTDAFMPRYVRSYAQGKLVELNNQFTLGSELVAILVVSLSAVLFYFGQEILSIWLREVPVSNELVIIFRLLVVSVCLNIIISSVDALQVVSGDMRVMFISRVLALIVIGPALYFMINKFGAVGAPWCWLIINGVTVAVVPHYVFRSVLGLSPVSWGSKWLRVFAISIVTVWVLRNILTTQYFYGAGFAQSTGVIVGLCAAVIGINLVFSENGRAVIRSQFGRVIGWA